MNRLLLVNQECDDPFENTVKKGVAAARMDLCLSLRFNGIRPVSPLERFERNEIEIETLLEFRDAWIFDECNGVLPRFRDIRSRKDFAMEAA